MNHPIRHGGNLLAAVRRHGRPAEDWVDLSTGINPHGYPVPTLPGDAWRCLPQDDDGLAELAAHAYGAPQALPVAGSQAAIRTLPTLFRPGRVGIAALGYSEYAPAFSAAGHTVVLLDEADFARTDLVAAVGLDHLVVVNPNNPTGRCVPAARLLGWHAGLVTNGGTLVVDEAFIDCLAHSHAFDGNMDPIASLAASTGQPGLVVLRSIGKFYGLAGLRCGFVLGEPALLDALGERLGHWTVSGPARAVARIALRDGAWQADMRVRLREASARLDRLLRGRGLTPVTMPLFAWVAHGEAPRWHASLAREGIWTRLFDAPAQRIAMPPALPSLRLGLPADDDAAWHRLAHALSRVAP